MIEVRAKETKQKNCFDDYFKVFSSINKLKSLYILCILNKHLYISLTESFDFMNKFWSQFVWIIDPCAR